jgi:hypothetical protein
VDRRLLGTLAIAAIISSALVNLLFAEKVERSIEILKNTWDVPSVLGHMQLPIQERRYPYTLSMMVRRPVHDLVLKFGVLRNQTFVVNYTGWQNLTMMEKAVRLKRVGELDEKVRGLSELVDVEVLQKEVDFDWEGERFKLLLLDYSSCLKGLAPPQAGMDISLVFAVIFGGSGNISQFYSGYPEFFLARKSSIQDLVIQLNDNATRYSPTVIEQPGSFPLDDLPALGTVRFRDLGKDDRLFFSMAINGARVEGTGAIMQVVQMRVDGEYEDPIINILKR